MTHYCKMIGVVLIGDQVFFFHIRMYCVCTNKQTKLRLYTFFRFFFVLGVQLLYRDNLPVV